MLLSPFEVGIEMLSFVDQLNSDIIELKSMLDQVYAMILKKCEKISSSPNCSSTNCLHYIPSESIFNELEAADYAGVYVQWNLELRTCTETQIVQLIQKVLDFCEIRTANNGPGSLRKLDSVDDESASKSDTFDTLRTLDQCDSLLRNVGLCLQRLPPDLADKIIEKYDEANKLIRRVRFEEEETTLNGGEHEPGRDCDIEFDLLMQRYFRYRKYDDMENMHKAYGKIMSEFQKIRSQVDSKFSEKLLYALASHFHLWVKFFTKNHNHAAKLSKLVQDIHSSLVLALKNLEPEMEKKSLKMTAANRSNFACLSAFILLSDNLNGMFVI